MREWTRRRAVPWIAGALIGAAPIVAGGTPGTKEVAAPGGARPPQTADPCPRAEVLSDLYHVESGVVTGVESGDTVQVRTAEGTVRVHLVGVAAPAASALSGDDLAAMSKLGLQSLCLGKAVDVWYHGVVHEPAAEVTAMVRLHGADRDLGLEQLAAGLVARRSSGPYTQNARDNCLYDRAAAARPDPLRPPADAVSWCSGHVTGQPVGGAAPPHIVWEAFTSDRTVAELAAAYAERLGPPTAEALAAAACVSFRKSLGGAERAVEICPVATPGPWSDCAAPARGRTVVFVSTLAGGRR